jgi:hypothetical protein
MDDLLDRGTDATLRQFLGDLLGTVLSQASTVQAEMTDLSIAVSAGRLALPRKSLTGTRTERLVRDAT